MTRVRGVLLELDGEEYLVTPGPDILVRDAAGGWTSVKRAGRGGRGLATASAILQSWGLPTSAMTHPSIRSVAAHALAELVREMFGGARALN